MGDWTVSDWVLFVERSGIEGRSKIALDDATLVASAMDGGGID